jgi:hypothetical protein
MRNGPGPYTLTIAAAGVYNIMAGMDADDSGGPPNPAVDPIVAYEHNPVTVSAGAAISGVDILLRDPTPPSTGSISGRISYTGHISPSHPIIVFVSRWGEQGPPSYSTVIPGAGFYTITNVAAYTYTVGAFMDLGDDMGPPQAGEPFNWYDPNGDGNPDVVIVRENEPLTAIDIVLHDLLRYIYLPSIHR